MCDDNYEIKLLENGGLNEGILIFDDADTDIIITVPMGSKFHSKATKILTDHPNSEIEALSEYNVLKDYSYRMKIVKPGLFSFNLVLEDQIGPLIKFIVNPRIVINGEEFKLNELRIQTNFSHCLGKLDKWISSLETTKKLGFNMVHLTPFHECEEFSPYSIVDFKKLSPDIISNISSTDAQFEELSKTLKLVEEKLGMAVMTDVVLNQTSINSPWVKEHPEFYYTEESAPWLRPAILVDDIVYGITSSIASGKNDRFTMSMFYTDASQIQQYICETLIASDFRHFYVVNETEALKNLLIGDVKNLSRENQLLHMRAKNYNKSQRINILRGRGIVDRGDIYHRDCICIDPGVIVALYFGVNSLDNEKLKEFKEEIKALNAPLLMRFESLCHEIAKNVVDSIVEDPQNAFLKYFHYSDGLHYALSTNCKISDAINGEVNLYLSRTLTSVSNSLKLNYASGGAKLVEEMKKYIESISKISHAIRIYNSHDLDIDSVEKLVRSAREKNPNILVLADICSDAPSAKDLALNVGVNAFQLDASNTYDPKDFAKLLNGTGMYVVGAVDPILYSKVVTPTMNFPIVLFDSTQDSDRININKLMHMAALAMSSTAVGSIRTYEDLLSDVPRVYDDPFEYSDEFGGLSTIRKKLNDCYIENNKYFGEIYAKAYKGILIIIRYDSVTGDGRAMLLRFDRCFDESIMDKSKETRSNRHRHEVHKKVENEWVFEIPADLIKLEFEAKVESVRLSNNHKPGEANVTVNKDNVYTILVDRNKVDCSKMPDNSIAVFSLKTQILGLEKHVIESKINEAIDDFSLIDFNVLLFRTSPEEHEITKKAAYNFPDYGETFYAGIVGLVKAFDDAINSPEGMNHSIFENIRNGDWLIEYTMSRLLQNPNLLRLQIVLKKIFAKITELPRFLVPRFVDRVFRVVYDTSFRKITTIMSDFVEGGDDFIKKLSVAALAFYGPSMSAPLYKMYNYANVEHPDCSLSAGLPHFAVDWCRCWGRDVFISLRGLFMVTGRYSVARDHILAFAYVESKGLIPNLYNSGQNPRYNSRDSTWYFLQACKDYYEMAPDGNELFDFKVDDYRKMRDVIHKIMEYHYEGIHIIDDGDDDLMKDKGRKLDIIVDRVTGFVFGGNKYNCGTWMDKMGSHKPFKGKPSTPRDGASIEIVGLCASVLKWLDECSKLGLINGIVYDVTFSEWYERIMLYFDKWFFIPSDPKDDDDYYVDENLIRNRGIYKDVIGSHSIEAEYKFRPNVLVAMCVAPEIFNFDHAVEALDKIEDKLMGKIGIKTLSEDDPHYRPIYTNGDDDDDRIAHGYSYHNGPEWVWLSGYFFRASMRFRRPFSERMKKFLARIKSHLFRSHCDGLPELTQKDGGYCYDGCQMQAWSVGSILDALYEYSCFVGSDVDIKE